MLADNEETQRTGYLWLEFQRPDPEAPGGVAFRTIGCGIRANRSTNRTTPWWFSTPRRPRIDFTLTVNKVPLAVDALRAELGSDAVFTTPSEYRAEVARCFFGGADPAGYLALLHQVRNPRVGDRIDADLPRRLQDALPPVPEEAVADAAQPLEDLEEHRPRTTSSGTSPAVLAGPRRSARLACRWGGWESSDAPGGWWPAVRADRVPARHRPPSSSSTPRTTRPVTRVVRGPTRTDPDERRGEHPAPAATGDP
jgi:hypothetical protein